MKPTWIIASVGLWIGLSFAQQPKGGRDRAEEPGRAQPSSFAPTSARAEKPEYHGSDKPRWYRPVRLEAPQETAQEPGRFRIVLEQGVYYIYDYETPKDDEEDVYDLYVEEADGCRRTGKRVVLKRSSVVPSAQAPTQAARKHGRPD